MKYTVDRHYYSYFGGADKHEYKEFGTLAEAWSAYKCTKANDYNYGDAWQSTTLRVIHDDSVILKPQRPHARTEYEWLKLKDFMLEYECFGMSAAYVEQHTYDIMHAYQMTLNPFDLFDDDFDF